MRGKGLLGASAGGSSGITPAYAGKSVRYTHHRAAGWDHPRLCGEKVPAGNAYSSVRGSPPPMRGKGSIESIIERRIRITPAYAGKSYQRLRHFPACRDHPRLCGEKHPTQARHRSCVGSPPPMRGKGVPAALKVQHIGITPAYAGKRQQEK